MGWLPEWCLCYFPGKRERFCSFDFPWVGMKRNAVALVMIIAARSRTLTTSRMALTCLERIARYIDNVMLVRPSMQATKQVTVWRNWTWHVSVGRMRAWPEQAMVFLVGYRSESRASDPESDDPPQSPRIAVLFIHCFNQVSTSFWYRSSFVVCVSSWYCERIWVDTHHDGPHSGAYSDAVRPLSNVTESNDLIKLTDLRGVEVWHRWLPIQNHHDELS